MRRRVRKKVETRKRGLRMVPGEIRRRLGMKLYCLSFAKIWFCFVLL